MVFRQRGWLKFKPVVLASVSEECESESATFSEK